MSTGLMQAYNIMHGNRGQRQPREPEEFLTMLNPSAVPPLMRTGDEPKSVPT